MATSSLGNFNFVVFHRPEGRGAPPALLAQEVETTQRPGTDGTGIIRLGTKQQPFQMRSGVDVPTFAAANTFAALYHASQGTGPYVLVWNGIDYSQFDVLYVPIKVEVQSIRRINAAAGGLNTNPQAWLECLWTLQPVRAAEPE